jgi:DNA-binding transcriptional LysR family regulator
MPSTKLSNLDLNLLVSLDMLLEERSVTRAAGKLGLSQSALSASLARLRRHFGDELLVRVGNRLELTPLGAGLRESTKVALAGVERVFSSERDFDPARSELQFTVILSDYATAFLGRELSAAVAREAPGVRLRLEQLTPDAVDRAPDVLRTADGLVLPHGFVSGLPFLDLYTDRWMCIVAEDRPEELTLEGLAEALWVINYDWPGAFTTAVRQLRILGIEPRAQIVTDNFLSLPFLVAGTDRIAIIPERLATTLAPVAGVRAVPCPFDAMPLAEALWWHPAHTREAGHRWLRRQLSAAGQRIGGGEQLSGTPAGAAAIGAIDNRDH